MHIMFSLPLLIGLSLCSLDDPEKPKRTNADVPTVKGVVVLGMSQITSTTPVVAFDTPAPMSSLEEGLPCVQKGIDKPVLAMTEKDGWFIYATSVGRDENEKVVLMISGYAIKRDGRKVIGWSAW
jgi:hypothetical protein